jgi:glycosyltransferase involved in cell wall biosynthesis
MHILLIHQAFVALDEPGGTRHHELALRLAAAGHRVTVIASPVSYLTGRMAAARGAWRTEQDGGPGVRILRAYTYPALHRSFVHRVFSFLSFMFSSFWIGLGVRQVDLVWGTSPPIFQAATAWMLARLKRAVFLFEVRDLWPAFAVAVGVLRSPLLIRLSEWLERFLYRAADRVMVNSPGFVDHVGGRGARAISLVPNGADTAMFDPLDEGRAFRERHALGDSFVVLYAGAHGLSNDLGVVLQAAAGLCQVPGIALVLLGDGKEKPALQAQALRQGLKNVHFIPPVPKRGMAPALAAADCCLGILKPVEMYRTVYPNKIFDYMAAGRPVILAMEGVIREVVEAAQAGIPIPPGDPQALEAAVLSLYGDPQGRKRMGLNGRKYVETHFDRLHWAGELVKIVEDLHRERQYP